jgi:FKBP12-rapamycin complex-associated protein
MAVRATNVDFVESEITRALEWLRSDRSQRRYVNIPSNRILYSVVVSNSAYLRLAACLTLKELAIHAPTAFYAKTSTSGHGGSNEFLDQIASVLSDPQPIVRTCAADALSQCLKILVDRRHASLTAFLCQIHSLQRRPD